MGACEKSLFLEPNTAFRRGASLRLSAEAGRLALAKAEGASRGDEGDAAISFAVNGLNLTYTEVLRLIAFSCQP